MRGVPIAQCLVTRLAITRQLDVVADKVHFCILGRQHHDRLFDAVAVVVGFAVLGLVGDDGVV